MLTILTCFADKTDNIEEESRMTATYRLKVYLLSTILIGSGMGPDCGAAQCAAPPSCAPAPNCAPTPNCAPAPCAPQFRTEQRTVMVPVSVTETRQVPSVEYRTEERQQ